ncbi:type II/IV secretion system protein, partial [Candidatus Uhrbacteria bacterium]|nr:type II/IV secretion system protein [Candidatus Uhrbacteria bacterium]
MADNKMGSIEDLMGGGNKPTETDKAKMSTGQQLQSKMGSIRLDQLERATEQEAANKGVQYINLKGFPVNPEALRLLPEEKARELKMIPFLMHGDELRIGSTAPNDDIVKDAAYQMGERNKLHEKLYLISEQSLEQGLRLYSTLPKIKAISKGVQIPEEQLKEFRSKVKKLSDVEPLLKDVNVTDLIAAVLAAAIEIGSSDIHIEAEEKDVAIRYRIDGVLQDVAKIPKELWGKLISRIKLVAGLKLNVVSNPQDGRYTIAIDGQNVDVRTSTLPTNWGESVVMRLLKPSAIGLKFDDLGFRPPAFKKLQAEIVKPNAMIITTGPTGSGKTTTLYSILSYLNKSDVKIITLEDPIEYKLAGINQSQIDHAKEYTFNKGLRSFLRQDPDIVMVGEIRDKETADTAVQASLTGHLLLSTIHTNDAAGAIPRFLSMGVEASLLAPALRIIMGQRLLRRLCKTCAVPHELSAE